MKNKRFFLLLVIAFAAFPLLAAFTGKDYREAGWLTLRFFGAQRCGNTGNWALVGHDPAKGGEVCHTHDGDTVGHDLTGGWHDCGDHWKVCFTQGFAAYTLLKAYDVFPLGFQDIYKQRYVYTDSMPAPDGDGIPDVINEAKVATDYFIKAIPDENTFYAECGNPNLDHLEWKTSAYQSLNPPAKGGDPRPVVKLTNQAGASCAQFTAALAIMARLCPRFGMQSYADSCKTAALRGYAYAKKNYGNMYSNGGFYAETDKGAKGLDDMTLAATELYFLTNDETYKTDALGYISGQWESTWAYSWGKTWDAAYYNLLKIDPALTNNSGKTILKMFENGLAAGLATKNSAGLCFYNSWGSCRYAGGLAFAMMLLYDITKTLDPDTSARALGLAKSQVDYCMGTNEFNRSFIHGFGPNSWDKVHHRNIQGNDDNLPDAQKETTPFKFKRSGALIGGPTAVNTFNNSVVDYTCTESGCDYNAGIAGALAGLISINAPYAVPVKNPGPEEQRVLPAAGSLAVAPLVSVGNRRVRIDYALKETGRCSVTILNARAQVIAAVAGGVATAGAHRAVWDASQAGPGPYFCDLTIGSYSIVRKILLTK
jgi:Glycosyl hydrolase family 9.